MGFIGNQIESMELVPFEGDAIKEIDVTRQTAQVDAEVKTDARTAERELARA